MAKKRIDAVVVGGGHNGLIAAALLQKSGKQVVLLERAEDVGGILRPTSPAPGFTAPGLVHTVGRLRASVVKDLKLERYGYRTVTPDVRMHAPMPDGTSVTFWGDAARTAEELRARSAADAEDRSEKSAVTPGRLVPARELLGDMLLETGRPAEALAEYERSQLHDPNRYRGLYGAGQAAAQSGSREKARYYYVRLIALAGPEGTRSELPAVREYLARN